MLLGHVLHILRNMVEPRRHSYCEWPNRCQGWMLPELVEFKRYCIRKGLPCVRGSNRWVYVRADVQAETFHLFTESLENLDH